MNYYRKLFIGWYEVEGMRVREIARLAVTVVRVGEKSGVMKRIGRVGEEEEEQEQEQHSSIIVGAVQ